MLWSFAGSPIDGAFPYGNLIYDANNGLFYGMTQGGSNSSYTYLGAGSIISFNPFTNKESVVWNFGSGTDGYIPNGNLIYDAGNKSFYGMTRSGGNKDTAKGGVGAGTIINFNPTGNAESVVWNLDGTPSDGFGPSGSLVYDTANGLFYGTTYGGGADSLGTIISFNPTGNTESLVWSFESGTDGDDPNGSLVYDAGNGLFYGMTPRGGSNKEGTIISFNPASNAEQVLWNFGSGKDGIQPYGNLVLYPLSVGAGINQLSESSEQLTIFPNPTSGQFTIKLNDCRSNTSVEVYNVAGQQVYKSVLTNSQKIINLTSQPEDVYFVQVKSEQGVAVEKLMLDK